MFHVKHAGIALFSIRILFSFFRLPILIYCVSRETLRINISIYLFRSFHLNIFSGSVNEAQGVPFYLILSALYKIILILVKITAKVLTSLSKIRYNN